MNRKRNSLWTLTVAIAASTCGVAWTFAQHPGLDCPGPVVDGAMVPRTKYYGYFPTLWRRWSDTWPFDAYPHGEMLHHAGAYETPSSHGPTPAGEEEISTPRREPNGDDDLPLPPDDLFPDPFDLPDDSPTAPTTPRPTTPSPSTPPATEREAAPPLPDDLEEMFPPPPPDSPPGDAPQSGFRPAAPRRIAALEGGGWVSKGSSATPAAVRPRSGESANSAVAPRATIDPARPQPIPDAAPGDTNMPRLFAPQDALDNDSSRAAPLGTSPAWGSTRPRPAPLRREEPALVAPVAYAQPAPAAPVPHVDTSTETDPVADAEAELLPIAERDEAAMTVSAPNNPLRSELRSAPSVPRSTSSLANPLRRPTP